MDPRERADAALARARARGAFVVTPEDAISPMDAANTLQIPRVVVSSLDEQRADTDTMVVGHPLSDPQPTQSQPSPRRPQPYPSGQQPQAQQQPQPQPPRQAPPPEQEQDPKPEGMIPTVQKRPRPSQSLSQRLDGTL
ncbi:hypothetical protein LWC34_24920 [Kibdelosporangium philippinense]|uniref:Uncharacterized protein n=1 Tax=Kibdelosporangium philippinense TaxID=211113 RepID=A0ABS8ZDY7_9PSEU|nr:hypothetical protein [Kibdelosporangium philippinense]MCE7006051.1 hypothetical protein [Kibdelosporangium philippinense]